MSTLSKDDVERADYLITRVLLDTNETIRHWWVSLQTDTALAAATLADPECVAEERAYARTLLREQVELWLLFSRTDELSEEDQELIVERVLWDAEKTAAVLSDW